METDSLLEPEDPSGHLNHCRFWIVDNELEEVE